jgi:hypothetical protein
MSKWWVLIIIALGSGFVSALVWNELRPLPFFFVYVSGFALTGVLLAIYGWNRSSRLKKVCFWVSAPILGGTISMGLFDIINGRLFIPFIIIAGTVATLFMRYAHKERARLARAESERHSPSQ